MLNRNLRKNDFKQSLKYDENTRLRYLEVHLSLVIPVLPLLCCIQSAAIGSTISDIWRKPEQRWPFIVGLTMQYSFVFFFSNKRQCSLFLVLGEDLAILFRNQWIFKNVEHICNTVTQAGCFIQTSYWSLISFQSGSYWVWEKVWMWFSLPNTVPNRVSLQGWPYLF